MRFSIFALLRLSVIAFLVVSTLGVAVGRLSTNPISTLNVDHQQPWTVAQHVIAPVSGTNLILETGNDKRIEIDFGQNYSTDLLSVSPFVNAAGQRELVARRRLISGEGSEMMSLKLELARFRYPDGSLIDSREVDWMPNSIPAWDVRVDRGLKTVFSTGAGYLVNLNWTDARGLPVSHRGERIEWAVRPPLGEGTNIGEPAWVTDPRYQDRLIVAFWGKDESSGEFQVGLAWIELDIERRNIIDCGVLGSRNLGLSKNSFSVRSPSVAKDAGGRNHLMWMERDAGEKPWRLNKARIEETIDSTTGMVAWRLGATTELAHECMPAPARFDETLTYAYFVVPNSRSCYDGGQWRKARVEEPRASIAFRSTEGMGFNAYSTRHR